MLFLSSTNYNFNSDIFDEENILKTSAAPVININLPINYTLYGKTAPNYSINIAEGLGNYSWYEFIETGNSSVPIELNGIPNENVTDTFDQNFWDNLSNGTATIRFYVNNSLGEVGYSDAIIRIDIIDPYIEVISPTGGYFNSTPPDFIVEISETHLNKSWYTLNINTTKHFFQDNGTIDQNAWIYEVDGVIDINFFVNDSVGNEDSKSVQVTKDQGTPIITDNQLGDDTWRNVSGTAYDVDFSDPTPSSTLDNAQYRIMSDPGQTGTEFQAWTNIFDDLGASSYIINWTINFTVCQEGINYISVRVYDEAGNMAIQDDVFYVRKDLTNPLIIDNQGGDDTWRNSSGTTYDVDFSDSTSNLDYAQYKITTATGQGGTILQDWTNIFDDLGASSYIINWTINFTACQEGINYISVRVYDEAGNMAIQDDVFEVKKDTIAPSQPIGLSVNPSAWTNIDSFNLSWTNPSDTSGIAGVYYKLDSAPEFSTDGTYISGIDINSITDLFIGSDGNHTIYIWLVDAAGNTDNNTFATTQLYLDTTDPIITDNQLGDDIWQNSVGTTYDVDFSDSTSNLDYAQYKITTATGQGGTVLQDWTNIFENLGASSYIINWTINFTACQEGINYISVRVYDEAGNLATQNDVFEVRKDTVAPSQPMGLSVNPSTWTNIDSFNLSWTNPLDTSGIAGVYYSIDSIPTSGTDGTKIDGTDIESILDLSVGSDGNHTIYIWLIDLAGNINHTFYSLTQLYLDTTPPTLRIDSPADGSEWNIEPDIQVNASDLSVESVWYTVGGTKVMLTNGISEPLDSGIWDNLSGEQEFTIYFFANDTAGNINDSISYNLYKDILAPRLTINTPSNQTYFNESFSINVLVLEANLITFTYTVIGYSPKLLFNNTDVPLDQTIWNDLSEGEFQITISAFDGLGNESKLELTLYKDTFAPEILINSPNNNTYWNDVFPINVSVFDPNFHSLWYRYNTTNIPLTNNSEVLFNQSIWESLPEGLFHVYIYANDSFNHINDSYYLSLYKDTKSPDLTINSPADGSRWDAPPDIQVTATDPSLDRIWYIVGGTKIMLTNGVSEPLNLSIWDSLDGECSFAIYFYANDTAGNINNTYSLILFKDILPPRLIINQPTNQTYYDSPPSINVTCFDQNFNHLSYTVIGYLPNDIWLDNNTEVLLDQTIWDQLDQGEFLLSFVAYDDFGHRNDTLILTLYKDTEAPTIVVNSPDNQSFHNSPPIINVTAFDPNLHQIWYRVGTTTIQLTNNTDQTLDNGIWGGLIEGPFDLELFANDTFGHVNNLINLTLNKDLTAPEITILAPLNNTYYANPPDMELFASDLSVDSVWYTVGGTKIMLSNGVSEPLDSGIWDSLPQEDFQVFIFANDSAGNLNNTLMLTLYKDTLPPIVIVNKPTNNSYWNSRPIINVEAFDPNLDEISYRVSGYQVVIENGNDTQLLNLIWQNLGEGPFILEIFAEDIFGQVNDSIKLTLYKDTVIPEITINFPQPNDIFGTIAPDFDVSIVENNLNSTWYTLIGGLSNYTFVGPTGTINQTAWELFPNGTVTIRFYANDTAKNINYADVTVRKNVYAPIITINSPSYNEIFGVQAPTFEIYKSGSELQTTWYTLDNGLTNFTFTGLSGTINQAAWDNFDYQTITISFYINDSLGKIGYDEVIVRKDPDEPTIIINSPTNFTAFASEPLINLTVVDPNLDSVWYIVNNTIFNITDNLDQPLNSQIWNNLPQGTFTIEIFANDTLGNLNNFYQLTLSKDTIGPNINIILPEENQKIGRDAPYFEISIFDENNIDFSWYTIDGENDLTFFTGTIGRINQTQWENLWDNASYGDTISITFYANDTLGNVNYKFIKLIKEEPFDIFKFLISPIAITLPIIGIGIMLPVSLKITSSRYYKALNEKEKNKLKKIIILSFFFLSITILFYVF